MTTDAQRAAMRAIARGEAEPLGELYRYHAARLIAAGRLVLDSGPDLEDLLHDVFLEAWREAGSYEAARGTVGCWLRVKMRSRAWDRRRLLARRGRLLGRGMRSLIPASGCQQAETVPETVALRDALDALPDSQRAVMELTYFADLSAMEIAVRTGIPIGTVKSRIAASLRALRRALAAGPG